MVAYDRTSIADPWASAEVTICQVGANGWHVHSTYSTIDSARNVAGLCGTVATIEEAQGLYERAVGLARDFVRREGSPAAARSIRP